MAELTRAQVRAARLRAQLLRPAPKPSPASPALDQPGRAAFADLVGWFGAMQGQDLPGALWSLGSRVPGSTVADVVQAFDSAALVRTWPMRGTLHVVPGADAGWMLRLFGARALGGVAKRWENLGLDRRTAHRAADVLAAALAGGRGLTRAEALETLAAAGIDTSGQRGYHLLWHTCQIGVACLGPFRAGEQTYRLLAELVPAPVELDDEEALAELVLRYFRSHGPATAADFAGWAGVPAGWVRRGLDACAGRLASAAAEGGRIVWADPAVLAGVRADQDAGRGGAPTGPSETVFAALAGFDEYVLGYKDRSDLGDPAALDRLVPGRNGVFRPSVMRDGRLAATWTRRLRTRSVLVEVTPLPEFVDQFEGGLPDRLAAVFAGYARYLGTELELRRAG